MSFKPFSKKYCFEENILIEDFPDYFHQPLADWIFKICHDSYLITSDTLYGRYSLNDNFRNVLQVIFHETFPQEFTPFVSYVLSNQDRTTNFLAYCLQNYANRNQANIIENILKIGSSAYQVTVLDKDAPEYNTGNYDLILRVAPELIMASDNALSNNLLRDAWQLAYSRKPDDEKVVTKCSNFLEGYLGKKYFPNDTKPQLTKFIHSFSSKPDILKFQGDTLISPKSKLTDLLMEVSNIRGQHTEGKGRIPTHDEAIFVLHTTILIWSLDNGIK